MALSTVLSLGTNQGNFVVVVERNSLLEIIINAPSQYCLLFTLGSPMLLFYFPFLIRVREYSIIEGREDNTQNYSSRSLSLVQHDDDDNDRQMVERCVCCASNIY